MQPEFSDSLNILGKPRLHRVSDSLGILGDVELPNSATSLKGNGFTSKPQGMSVPVLTPQEEAPRFKDSLGLLSGGYRPPVVSAPEEAPGAPQQFSVEDFSGEIDRRAQAPGEIRPRPEQFSPETVSGTTKQIYPETMGDPSRDEAGYNDALKEAMRKRSESEINKRLDQIMQATYAKGQQAKGRKIEDVERDVSGLKEPFVDPISAAAAAFGGGATFALNRGAALAPALMRGAVSAIPATMTDIPIGQIADSLSDKNPEIGFLAAVAMGLASGLTIENLTERGILKLIRGIATKHPEKAAAMLSEDVLKKFKSAGPSEAWSPEISDQQAAKMEKWKAKAAARAQTPGAETAGEIPWSRSGGMVEDVLVSHTGPEKPFSDSIHILNPRSERSIVEGPVSIETARGKSIQAGLEASAKQREAAFNTEDLLPWIAKKGGLQPTPELEDLAWTMSAEGRKVRAPGVPPNFLRKNSEWAMDTLTQEAIDEGFLPKGATQNDLFDAIEKDLGGYYGLGRRVKRASAIEDFTSDELAEQEMEYLAQKGKALWMHPSTITGPLGGVAAGFDREAYEKDGTIRIDPRKALIGAVAGAAGGVGLAKAKSFGATIAHLWDAKIAEPFIDLARKTANGLIVHEDVRRYLGMGRSKAFQDLMRDYQREVQGVWSRAVEIGKELQAIAGTQTEQRRLMQVIRGSITSNAEMRRKADEVISLFEEMRQELKQHSLLEYSRFDKLTRAERARLRALSSMPDPATIKDWGALQKMAQDLGMTPKKGLTRDQLISDIQKEIEFNKGRLSDYYHYASAREYAPLMYAKQEGLSPQQMKVLQEEIDHLKVKSRRGNPEGQQDLEALISRLESMLGEGAEARKAQRITHHALNKSYAHQRLEMPIEVQRMLGLIEEAPFPVAKGLGVQMSDLRKAKLFQHIADQPGWTIRKTRGVDVPANFKLIEDERFGPLNGLHVRKDIWEDLKEVEEWRGWFVQNYDKYMGYWKFGKVVLNPATHMRNGYSNMILAYLGDVNPTDVKTYGKAAAALKGGEKNKFYSEAKSWGLFNNTFFSSEIGKLRDELSSVRDPSALKNWIRKAMAAPADLYQGNEKFFKLAVYIKARESGMEIDEAARKAEKFLFNYGDVPPLVKHAKRWVSPFFTFTWKAVPLFAEMAIRKPHKVAAIMAAMYGMEEYSRRKLGLSGEEAEKERALLPEWQQKRQPPFIGPYTQVLMPFQDQHGDNLYLDLSYILPYGNLAEKWGQSALPLSDILPSNPLFQMAATILTNREPFTGRPVYDEVLDGAGKIAAKYLEYSWREIAPSMAPGGYGWNKIKTGLMNTLTDKKVLDWADRPIELQTALLSSLLGVKLSPANTAKLKQFESYEMRKVIDAARTERGRLGRDLQKNKIDKAEYQKQVRELADMEKRLLKEKK